MNAPSVPTSHTALDGVTVYILHHVYERDDEEQAKFIGVYASAEHAQAAVVRLSSQLGFCDYPEGFQIDPYLVNKDHWTEGFVVEHYSDDDENDDDSAA